MAAAVAGGCGFNANDPLADLPAVSLDRAPPPLSGGTLHVTRDAQTAVAADPDRDALYVVDLAREQVRTVTFAPGDEPGRVAEDAARGRVYVVLRGAGELATVDLASASVTARRAVCSAPRGVDYDAASDRLWVACARGELVDLAADAPDATAARTLDVGGDLRDVVVHQGRVLVSRMRSAAVVAVDPATRRVGTAVRPPVARLRGAGGGPTRSFEPSVAWRLRASAAGPVLVHQRGFRGPEEDTAEAARSYSYSRSQPTGWRDPCGNGVAHGTATFWSTMAQSVSTVASPAIERGVLPVDVAVSPSGRVAVALAGELGTFRAHGAQVALTTRETLARSTSGQCVPESRALRFPGQVVAVDFAGEALVVQTREPAQLVVGERVIALSDTSRRDTGHDVFHADLGGGIACASCHPEGGDDGRVWTFRATGPRRTPGMLGGLRPEGPYHWRGDVPTLRALMDGTMVQRMSGPVLDAPQFDAARRWLERVPTVPASRALDPARVARGRAVFERADTRCASCHAGPDGSDGQLHLLGAERWRTPPLRAVAARAPYFHDGCATTLDAALRGCGTVTGHGDAAHLGAEERADLLAYLESL